MNGTEPAVAEPSVDVREEGRAVLALLKEYAEKLAALNADILDAMQTPVKYPRGFNWRRAAWLLDQGELLKAPLTRVMSRGSGILAHSAIDPVTEDELALRMREIEVHLHHALRLTHELRHDPDGEREAPEIARLRVAAGLNATKGGPLRPNG